MKVAMASLKILAYVLGAILTVVLVAVAFAPMVLSSSWGKEQILNYLNRQLNGGTASIANLELSWSGPQKIDQFVLIDNSGVPVVIIESFESHSSLFELIDNGFFIGNMSFKGFNAEIIPNPSTGKTNLEEVLGRTIFPKEIMTPIYIKNGTGLINFQDPSHIKLKVFGQTYYGDVTGDFNIDLQKTDQGYQWAAHIGQFPVAILDAILTFQHSVMQGMLSNFLGDAINLDVSEKITPNGISFDLQASSPLFSTSVSGKYESDNIVLTTPALVKLTVTPDLLRTLSKDNPKEWDLAEPVQLQFNLKNLSFPQKFFSDEGDNKDLSEWFLQSELNIPKIVFENLKHKELKATVTDLSLNINALPQSDDFSLQFVGNFAMLKDFVSFDLASSFPKSQHINKLKNALSMPSNIHVSVKDLPTVLLDVLLGTGSRLTDTLGKEVSFKFVMPQDDKKSLYISVQSSNFEASDILVKANQEIRFDGDLKSRDLSGYIAADRLSFLGTEPLSSITDFRMPWNIKNDFQTFDGSFSGKVKQQNEGSFDGNLRLNHRSNNVQIAFACQGKHIPSPYVELFTGRSEITPLFGKLLDFSLEGNIKDMSGPLQADINGERGKIKLRSHLDNGILKLKEPFEASVIASRDLGNILGKILPLFGELVSSQNPITITVFPENFYLPINSFDSRKVQIGKAVISAGKMQFSNGGELHKLLALLQASKEKEVTIWVTPLFLSMNNGILSVSRMDMLMMDHYHLATWGQIDFGKDSVDMVVGITGEALSYALEIPSLSKSEMLQLPLKGKTRNAKIDQAKAAARIASILAKHQGGSEGFILGTAIDIAGGKQPKVPPPTTSPLPWGDTHVQEPLDTETKEETSQRKKNKNSFKEIEKNASKLLNKLLG